MVMDDDGHQHQKELSISLAASSMINGSDTITEEAYRANLKRIQEVKEMVRKLEVNNESAHKNYLVDQLEKRAKEGRDAETMLAQLRNQPGLPEAIQFTNTNNTPSNKSEVILPTTATLVEVPESHPSSYPSSTATSYPQPVQHGRAAEYQWSLPPQVQPYSPNVFRYYTPQSTVRQPPQHTATPRFQTPIEGQMGWYTQHVPPQPGVLNSLGHQPTQVQQPLQSWSGYPPPVIALPAADTPRGPGYYTSSAGWIRTAPVSSVPNTSSSSMTYREPSFPTQPTASRPPATTHNQPQSLPSLVSTSQVPVSPYGVPTSSAKILSGQPTQSNQKPAESQSRTGVSKPVAISKSQKPPTRPQHHPLPNQPQQLPQSLPQPRQFSQPTQPHPQRFLQPPLQPQHQPQQSQELLSQPPPTHPQAPSQFADRVPSASVAQPRSQPSQPPQPTVVHEQTSQRGAQPPVDQATFIKLFRAAVQGGVLNLKAFFLRAKASGISDEWFSAAIRSVPRDVWESVMAQINQSGPTPDIPSTANVPQQQVSTIPNPNAPIVSVRPPPTATPLVPSTSATQQGVKPSTSTEGGTTLSAPGQASGQYAVQMQYYAEQATKSAQMASISTPLPGNITPTQKTVATPTRDVPLAQVNMRTPKDANKSTLARDILRSLGKTAPKPSQEMGGNLTEKANNHHGDQLPEVNAPQSDSQTASPERPVVPPATSPADLPSTPSAKSNVGAESHVVTSNLSIAKSVSKEKGGQAAIEGATIIDLTLEDSDESVDGKGQEPEPTFPIQTSASAATPSQPVSPTNTTNHTPLLESLSLEEHVDITADGDNADVRMYSPPLSLADEEYMESGLLYPPLGSAESVSPSFEPLSREVNEHPLDGQLPLFLPSPPVSPAHTEPPETDLEMTNDEGQSSLKRRSVDVDEIETDAESLTPRVRKRRKRQVYVLIPPAPLYVRKAIKKMKERAMGKDVGSDLEGEGEDEEFQYSHLEQLLIEESKSRLLERRCRWLNCSAVLNCAANLLAHLKIHALEDDSALSLCRWASCSRQFATEQDRDIHLERHIIRPLPCPFAGCDEQFNKPVEVMQHEVQHQKEERGEPLMRKPTYHPVVPAIPARLGPPPHRLPSHRVIPRRVVKCRISADRHAVMGPWVFWNIFSPVDLSTRKQNASMRGRPTRQAINYDIDNSDPRRDDYDFLLALSSYPAKNPQLDDLDSTLITMSAAQGLTLWGSRSTVNSAARTAAPEACTNVDAAVLVSATAEETKVEGKLDGSEVATTARENSGPKERQSMSVFTGEEEDVERMLDL